MLKLVTIDKESQYYSLIGNEPTSDFSKKSMSQIALATDSGKITS